MFHVFVINRIGHREIVNNKKLFCSPNCAVGTSAVGLTDEPGEATGTCAVGTANFGVTPTSFCETDGGSRLMTVVTSMTS